MRLRGFGGPAAIRELEQQVELHGAALIFRFRQGLHVVCGREMRGRLAQGMNGGVPRRAVGARDQRVGLAERHVAEQPLVGRSIRRGLRPAQDAHRGGAAPVSLVDAGESDLNRGRLRQANYRAMQSVALVRVGEFGVLVAGVDADAQVDVALADLDQVRAGPQLAAERQRLGAVDPDFGGVFDERLGFEAAGTGRKARSPKGRRGPRRAS